MSNQNNKESVETQSGNIGILPGMKDPNVGGPASEPGEKVGHTHGTSNQNMAKGGTGGEAAGTGSTDLRDTSSKENTKAT